MFGRVMYRHCEELRMDGEISGGGCAVQTGAIWLELCVCFQKLVCYANVPVCVRVDVPCWAEI